MGKGYHGEGRILYGRTPEAGLGRILWVTQVSTRDRHQNYIYSIGYESRSRRVLAAYTDDRPFSVDLVGAVIRQCSFIDKMDNYGWTEPGAFDSKEDEVVLVHAIARYHAYGSFLLQAVEYPH